MEQRAHPHRRSRSGRASSSLFLWLPLALIMLYAFNKSNVQSWPIAGFTTHWFHVAWSSSEVRDVAVALGPRRARRDRHRARARLRRGVRRRALPLLRARARCRSCSCSRSRCPGIVTGMALNSFFIAGHISLSHVDDRRSATRRSASSSSTTTCSRGCAASSPSLIEASQDLGADGWQTFRFVVWPVLSTALVAGGLLAFALSFDEVIVTYFTAGAQNTLPLLILGYIRLGQQLPGRERRSRSR